MNTTKKDKSSHGIGHKSVKRTIQKVGGALKYYETGDLLSLIHISYWKSILVILVLLFVQAWCDLSLPSYTSDIIDVGIQNLSLIHI